MKSMACKSKKNIPAREAHTLCAHAILSRASDLDTLTAPARVTQTPNERKNNFWNSHELF